MSTHTDSPAVTPDTTHKEHDTRIIESSGNVFVDLGFDPAEAEVLKLRAEVMIRTTEQLPQLLKAFRKNAGLTQADVAIRLGVTQQTVSALERNAEAVSAARLMKLLNILGVEWVLQNRSEPTVPASGETSDW